MTDGREELAYFPHRNGRDWIAWVPDGYYTSSVNGDSTYDLSAAIGVPKSVVR